MSVRRWRALQKCVKLDDKRFPRLNGQLCIKLYNYTDILLQTIYVCDEMKMSLPNAAI